MRVEILIWENWAVMLVPGATGVFADEYKPVYDRVKKFPSTPASGRATFTVPPIFFDEYDLPRAYQDLPEFSHYSIRVKTNPTDETKFHSDIGEWGRNASQDKKNAYKNNSMGKVRKSAFSLIAGFLSIGAAHPVRVRDMGRHYHWYWRLVPDWDWLTLDRYAHATEQSCLAYRPE